MFHTGFRQIVLTIACSALALSACSHDDDPAERKEPDDERPAAADAPRAPDTVPDTVSLAATTGLVSGFANGVLRDQVTLGGFRITRHPITRAQYQDCVDADACAASKGVGCAPAAFAQLMGRSTAEPESPLVCPTVKEAASYCRWIGGQLPTFAQWQLAARGPSPARFAWGDSEPSCERHPRVADTRDAFTSADAAKEAGCVPAAEAPLVVGRHPAGASASGLEDVLLTPAELLAVESNAQFSACSTGFAGCLVYGRTPGEIDAVFPIDALAGKAPAEQRAPQVFGFRCALEEN